MTGRDLRTLREGLGVTREELAAARLVAPDGVLYARVASTGVRKLVAVTFESGVTVMAPTERVGFDGDGNGKMVLVTLTLAEPLADLRHRAASALAEPLADLRHRAASALAAPPAAETPSRPAGALPRSTSRRGGAR